MLEALANADWTGLAQLLLIGLGIAWAVIVGLTAYRLASPVRRGYAARIAAGLPAESSDLDPPAQCDTWTTTRGGCPVWELKGGSSEGPVVVYCHGWGRSRHEALERFDRIRDAVDRFIACDLPGHGESTGHWCTLGAREHGVLLEIADSVGKPVVFWGWSMGSGVALSAATRHPMTSGVIFESGYRRPWTPASRVLALARLPYRVSLPPALWLLGALRGDWWRDFDRATLSRGLEHPILMLHGDADEVCPLQEAREIAEAAPDAKLVVLEGVDHRGLWFSDRAGKAAEEVRAFLRRLSESRLGESRGGD